MTIIRVKPDVRFHNIHPRLGDAIDGARDVWQDLGIEELWITSLNDSEHSRTSLHYAGCAVDLRSRNVESRIHASVTETLKTRLGPEYDVVFEDDHWHIEWQPKRPS